MPSSGGRPDFTAPPAPSARHWPVGGGQTRGSSNYSEGARFKKVWEPLSYIIIVILTLSFLEPFICHNRRRHRRRRHNQHRLHHHCRCFKQLAYLRFLIPYHATRDRRTAKIRSEQTTATIRVCAWDPKHTKQRTEAMQHCRAFI